MLKNLYDSDVATWSPQGRLYQIDYASEAINQGSTCVAVRNDMYGVIVALRRSPEKNLSSYQRKIFRVESHVGICVSGLISDSRKICNFMRLECMGHAYTTATAIKVRDLAEKTAEKMHAYTLSSSDRPRGMGILLIGTDDEGLHLYECWPSGSFLPSSFSAMGARYQLAKSYLESCEISSMNLKDLTLTALKALSASSKDLALTAENTSISFVAKNGNFRELTNQEVIDYVKSAQASS